MQLPDSLFEVRLERPLVELKQKLALADVVAFFKEDLFDLPIDLGTDLHRLIGLDVSNGCDLNRNIALLDGGNDDWRRGPPSAAGTGSLDFLLFATSAQQTDGDADQNCTR